MNIMLKSSHLQKKQVGFDSLCGAVNSRMFQRKAAFLSSVSPSLWRIGRGSRKACQCSTGLSTPSRSASLFDSKVAGFKPQLEHDMANDITREQLSEFSSKTGWNLYNCSALADSVKAQACQLQDSILGQQTTELQLTRMVYVLQILIEKIEAIAGDVDTTLFPFYRGAV
jgi:hypothetical protein